MTVETIGEALRDRWTLHVRCAQGGRDGLKSIRECRRSDKLDLASVVWTRGRNFPMSGLAARLMCPECGSRRVMVAFSPPAPGGAAVAAPLAGVGKAGLLAEMPVTVEEWRAGRLMRYLALSPNVSIGRAAFKEAVKDLHLFVGDSVVLKHGTRVLQEKNGAEPLHSKANAAE